MKNPGSEGFRLIGRLMQHHEDPHENREDLLLLDLGEYDVVLMLYSIYATCHESQS
ncbi:MAG: hypothetical protein RLZZ545_679 [Actinomycetota bacterium]|jgi:hypothetical protein